MNEKDYVRLRDACREGNFEAIHEDDLLDINMMYDLALNIYIDNYNKSEDDEMIAEWLNDGHKPIHFSVNGNEKFDGNNADEIIKIDNLSELEDKYFDLENNVYDENGNMLDHI